jgi:hypothetical protein
MDRRQRIFPCGPCPAIALFHRQITRKQPAVIGKDQIILFIRRNKVREPFPHLGPEFSCPTAIKPIQFRLRHQKHTAQHQLQCGLWMRLRVNQRQRRAPRSTKDDPFIDAQRLADQFNIGDQMPCRVVRYARMWP